MIHNAAIALHTSLDDPFTVLFIIGSIPPLLCPELEPLLYGTVPYFSTSPEPLLIVSPEGALIIRGGVPDVNGASIRA